MFPADLVTFTVEILNGKLHFLCSDVLYPRGYSVIPSIQCSSVVSLMEVSTFCGVGT